MALDVYASKLDAESEALWQQRRNAHILALLFWLAPEFIKTAGTTAAIGESDRSALQDAPTHSC